MPVTATSIPNDSEYYSIARNPTTGRIIAFPGALGVTYSDGAYSDDNGATWSPMDFGVSGSWGGFYGTAGWDSVNELFFAVDDSGTQGIIVSSDNGATWDNYSIPDDGIEWLCAAAGGGLIVIAGRIAADAIYITYSSDGGQTWSTPAAIPEFSSARVPSGLCHDGAQFLLTQEGDKVYTSPDAVIWTEQDIGTSATFYRPVWNGTVFFLPSYDGSGNYATSLDGETWIFYTTPAEPALADFTFTGVFGGSGKIMALGYGSAASDPQAILSSNHGVAWQIVDLSHESFYDWRCAFSPDGTVYIGIATSGNNPTEVALITFDVVAGVVNRYFAMFP